jgi:hypothetical protein
VTVVEAKPSAGRKFLMAGKSGLNITKDEPLEAFKAAYGARRTGLRRCSTPSDLARRSLGPRRWVSRLHRQHGAGLPRGDEGLPAPACMAAADRGGAAAGLALGRMGRGGVAFETGGPGPAIARASRFWRSAAPAGGGWDRTAHGPLLGGTGRGAGPVPPCEHGVRGGLDAPHGAASGPAAEIACA